MKLSQLFIISAIIVLLAGCNSTPVTIPNVPAKAPAKGQSMLVQSISAEDCGFQLLLFIPIGVNERQSIAYSKLVKQAPEGAKISDIKMEESWYYGLVGTGYCTKFTALATTHQ